MDGFNNSNGLSDVFFMERSKIHPFLRTVNHSKPSISMGHRKTMASRERQKKRCVCGQGMAMSLAKNLQAKFEMDPMDPTHDHYSQLHCSFFSHQGFSTVQFDWLKISCQIFHKLQVSHNTHQITMVKYWIDSFWSP